MTEVINSISDFEKYLKNTKKVVEEALDFPWALKIQKY